MVNETSAEQPDMSTDAGANINKMTDLHLSKAENQRASAVTTKARRESWVNVSFVAGPELQQRVSKTAALKYQQLKGQGSELDDRKIIDAIDELRRDFEQMFSRESIVRLCRVATTMNDSTHEPEAASLSVDSDDLVAMAIERFREHVRLKDSKNWPSVKALRCVKLADLYDFRETLMRSAREADGPVRKRLVDLGLRTRMGQSWDDVAYSYVTGQLENNKTLAKDMDHGHRLSIVRICFGSNGIFALVNPSKFQTRRIHVVQAVAETLSNHVPATRALCDLLNEHFLDPALKNEKVSCPLLNMTQFSNLDYPGTLIALGADRAVVESIGTVTWVAKSAYAVDTDGSVPVTDTARNADVMDEDDNKDVMETDQEDDAWEKWERIKKTKGMPAASRGLF